MRGTKRPGAGAATGGGSTGAGTGPAATAGAAGTGAGVAGAAGLGVGARAGDGAEGLPLDPTDTCVRTAWHEAGHAVVQHALGWRVQGIEANGDFNVEIETFPASGPVRTIGDMGERIAGLFGGYIAERRHDHRGRRIALKGALGDLMEIARFNPWTNRHPNEPPLSRLRLLADAVRDEAGWRSFARAWYRVAHEIVRVNWAPLGVLADAVVRELGAGKTGKNRSISGERLRNLLHPVERYEHRVAALASALITPAGKVPQ